MNDIVSEFQDWLKKYEYENHCEYFRSTGKKKCQNGERSYYECCRTGYYHKVMKNLKRKIKSQGSKKINQNCTSHIILFEYLNQDKCVATFYKEHHGHNEKELQHIRIPITKKHEIAAKLSQGVTINKILENLRDNIGTDLKRENLITRTDVHNIKFKFNNIAIQDDQFYENDSWLSEELQTTTQVITELNSLEVASENKIEAHVNSLENLKNNKNVYYKFKEKALSIINKIHLIENSEHLKEAMQKLNSLDVFIDTISNKFKTNNELRKYTCDPPNKKITEQTNFYSAQNRRTKNINKLSIPSRIKTKNLSNIFLKKKLEIIKESNKEHCYCKK